MITDVIVLASLSLALAFVAAWVISPGLRAWIERPKHHFHEAAKEYDLAQHRDQHAPEHPSS
jgi:hypothetical protein